MRQFWRGVLTCYLVITVLLTASMAQEGKWNRSDLALYSLSWSALVFSHATNTRFLMRPFESLVHLIRMQTDTTPKFRFPA